MKGNYESISSQRYCKSCLFYPTVVLILIQICSCDCGLRGSFIREKWTILTFSKQVIDFHIRKEEEYESISKNIFFKSVYFLSLKEQVWICFILICFVYLRVSECVCVCVFHWRATELSPLPYHGEFQSRGRDELVWNKLAVLTAQTAPALGYKLKQKQPYLHISASSPWNTIRSASIFQRATDWEASFFSSHCLPQTVPKTNVHLPQVFKA